MGWFHIQTKYSHCSQGCEFKPLLHTAIRPQCCVLIDFYTASNNYTLHAPIHVYITAIHISCIQKCAYRDSQQHYALYLNIERVCTGWKWTVLWTELLFWWKENMWSCTSQLTSLLHLYLQILKLAYLKTCLLTYGLVFMTRYLCLVQLITTAPDYLSTVKTYSLAFVSYHFYRHVGLPIL